MNRYSSGAHPYFYPGTEVLKNKFDIHDPNKLAEIENAEYLIGNMNLRFNPIHGEYDIDHLCKIHKALFGKVYDWAGELRTTVISKNGSVFAYPDKIRDFLEPILKGINKENQLKGLSKEAFSERAAYYFAEINAAHPFREGNGRAMRAFIDQLSNQTAYQIDWDSMSKEEYIQSSINSFNGDNKLLKTLFQENIYSLEKTQN